MLQNRLTLPGAASYNAPMSATAETALEEVFKHNTDFLAACQHFGWGKIEITIKDGRPVMVTVKKDIKLS
jgi:hypothetical protein